MLILKPIIHSTIWGGSWLTNSYSFHDKIGHLYGLVSNGKLESEILNGPYKGQLFKKYFDENKVRLNLAGFATFPYVLALVDAKENLSLQVHPDDKYAISQGLSGGKNESWFFLEESTSNFIYNGCKINSKEIILSLIKEGREKEIWDTLQVGKSGYVFVEAGTMHALSAGSKVFEIEENCDQTYRFYDFDRVGSDGKKRELQLNQAIEALSPTNKSHCKELDSGQEVHHRYYSFKYFPQMYDYENKSNTIETITLLSENVEIEGITVKRGMTIVLEPGDTVNLQGSLIGLVRPTIGGVYGC